MKNAERISRIEGLHLMVAIVAVATLAAVTVSPAQADPPARVTVTGAVDINVWLDNPWQVYPAYDDVVISVQATRGCYATVFVVDTYGFVHVIHPLSPYQSAWIRGGVTYRFRGRDLGLDAFGGRGIAHVFAIGSPVPFDYAPYGEAIFLGRYGYRIYGDPYVACGRIYVSMLPAVRRWDRIGVGVARFYVREWARYPVYLCYGYRGGDVLVRIDGRCERCYPVYETYRAHVNEPRVALRQAPRYKDARRGAGRYTRVQRTREVERYREAYEKKRSVRAHPIRIAGTRSSATTRGTKIVTARRSADRLVRAADRDEASRVVRRAAAKEVRRSSAGTRKNTTRAVAAKRTSARKGVPTAERTKKGRVGR